MDVILLQKVENLGGLGDRASVRPGYARNFLIPFGKAVPATGDRIAEFESRRAELERQAAENFAHAQGRKTELESVTVTLRAKASSEGKLYGSIGTADVAEALTGSAPTRCWCCRRRWASGAQTSTPCSRCPTSCP